MTLEVEKMVVLQQICRTRKMEVAVAYSELEEAAALASDCKLTIHTLSSTRSHSKSSQLVTIF